MSVNQNLFIKDPQAKLDYGFDWTLWMNSGDQISGSFWSLSPSLGMSIISSSFSPFITSVILASGTIGETYTVKNHIATINGLEDERTLYISIQDR